MKAKLIFEYEACNKEKQGKRTVQVKTNHVKEFNILVEDALMYVTTPEGLTFTFNPSCIHLSHCLFTSLTHCMEDVHGSMRIEGKPPITFIAYDMQDKMPDFLALLWQLQE